jgi:hypothetical protein
MLLEQLEQAAVSCAEYEERVRGIMFGPTSTQAESQTDNFRLRPADEVRMFLHILKTNDK